MAGADEAGKTRVPLTDVIGQLRQVGSTSIPRIVQKTNGVAASSTTLAVAFGANVTLGNTIVVLCGVGSSANVSATITDSLKLQYQTASLGAVNNIGIYAFFAPAVASGADTVTLTVGSSIALAMEIYEVEGLGILDVLPSPISSSGTTSATIALSVFQENELAFFAVGAGAGTISATSPASPASISSDSGNLATGGSNLVNFAAFSALLGSPIASTSAFSGNITNTFKATIGSSVAATYLAVSFRPSTLQVTGTVYPATNSFTLTDASANAGVTLPVGVGIGGSGGNYVNEIYPFLFNGSTWDRQRSAAGAQGTAAVGAGSSFPQKGAAAVSSKSTGSVASLTAAITPQSKGSLLIVSCAVGNGSTPTISDNAGNVYLAAVPWQLGPASAFGVGIFYAVAISSAATTVTVTNTGANASISMTVYEGQGLEIGGFDVSSSASGTSTSPSSGAATPSVYPEYAFGAIAVGTAAQTVTVTSGGQGFVNDSGQQNPVTPAGLYSFVAGSALLQNNAAATFAGTITSEPWAACIATFRPVAMQILGSLSQATASNLNATVVQGNKGSVAQSWYTTITDLTNGPVAVKAASVAATATDPALVVTTNGSTTAGAPANTSVTSTTSVVLAANTARRECTIVNTDVVVVYLGLGQTPTATAYHIALSPCTVAHDGTGGTYTTDVWKGAINGIVASTSGHVAIVELT